MKPDLTLVPSAKAPAAQDKAPLHSQTEMPFAVVEGQPVVELPKDLYIPPQALEVFLEAFEGPLDLLLYLIRRQNLDILDIPIAEITRQYTRYIEFMQVLQLELAGEYLLMAATLAEIKSRMLLPRVHSAEAGEEADPRAELVRRLQEYERFKRAAERMDRIPRLDRDTWVASAELADRKTVRIPPQVTLQEMLLAFQEVLQRSDMFAHHHVQREPLSVRQRMSDVLASLTSNAFVDFVKLFRPDEGRRGVTVTFVAILELLREGLIEIVQSEPYGPLHVRPGNPTRHLKLVADEDAPAAANDPAAIAANDDTHDARTDAADGEAAVAANGDTNGPRADVDAAADGDATAAPGGANDDLARSQ
jgi:segregation and condensation protein A